MHICSNVILMITRRSCKHLIIQISRRETITWHDMCNLCSHTIALFGNEALSDSQNLQNVGNDIVIFNGNVLGHAGHTWCKNGTNGKRMSCSLLVCHMRIFKLIDFRTMGLWKWITFFYTHCIDRIYAFIIRSYCQWKVDKIKEYKKHSFSLRAH